MLNDSLGSIDPCYGVCKPMDFVHQTMLGMIIASDLKLHDT